MMNATKVILLLLSCGVFGDDVKSVMEGDSVTLNTETELQSDDKILWRFKGNDSEICLLAEITQNKFESKDLCKRGFKDRLQISDLKTGSLTIMNMRIKHSGDYKADLETDTGTTSRTFKVTVNESRALDADTREEKSVSVTEGQSVTLHTNVTELHRGDLILWGFGNESVLIAKLDKDDNKPLYYNERFRDRLKLDDQTGSLTITNIRITDSGLYKLQINSKPTLYKTFSVSVSDTSVSRYTLSPGATAGIVVILLVFLAVVGVILYRYRTIIQQSQSENDSRKDRKKRKSESDCEIEEENNLKSAEN